MVQSRQSAGAAGAWIVTRRAETRRGSGSAATRARSPRRGETPYWCCLRLSWTPAPIRRAK